MSIPEIKNVAIIRAGISGVRTAAHLLKKGIQVTVFERRHIAGGVWVYDEEVAAEPAYPSNIPSQGGVLTAARTPVEDDDDAVKDRQSSACRASRVEFAPPCACYEGLRNNVPQSLMQNSLAPFPHDMEEFVSQKYVEQYIQVVADEQHVNDHTHFNTRVEGIRRIGSSWRVSTSTRLQNHQDDAGLLLRLWHFDAVVVASGRYHMPRIPDIAGLSRWKTQYSSRVSHSKMYRRPEAFRDQTILLIGAGTSSVDIAKELAGISKRTYQSSRGGSSDHPAAGLPENAIRFGGIADLELDANAGEVSGSQPIRGIVLLQNGLCNIDRVVLCTGYVTSYPFLPQYQDDGIAMSKADENVLVTREGGMVHNLHKDIFYMQDPTLSFIGKPYNTANFSLFEFQSQLLAKVYARQTSLPSIADMRAEYNERVEVTGLGREFHSLRATGDEILYVDSLVAWANAGSISGEDRPRGHSNAWKERYASFKKILEAKLTLRLLEPQTRPSEVAIDVVNMC